VSSGFACIRVRACDGDLAERASAEAFAAGAAGLEERAGEEGSATVELWIYAPEPAERAVSEALAALAREVGGSALRVFAAETAPDVDWRVRWREGLGIVRISARLAVRPPFVPDEAGARALVIDPGQAFGTGGHASTRLALELIDALPESFLRGARVLDAGTGSGVLALAALELGAGAAVGFDLDAVAVGEAAANASANGLGARALFFAGPISALGAPPFDLVVANLLRSEVLPILPDLAARLRPGGRAIFSGLLVADRDAVSAALARVGLSIAESREELDTAGDEWLGLLTAR
jgi:ribosomal protein L11 methyltransferase